MTQSNDPPFARYLALVTEPDLVAALREQSDETADLVRRVPQQEGDRVHPPYGWSIKQVLGHLIDTERVFGYRAMRISRGDATPLPSFDQDAFVAGGGFDKRSLQDLGDEFESLRRAHVIMFQHLPEGTWSNAGTASGLTWTVENLARAMVGHVRHHSIIIRKRLGIDG
jgi:hypothetical protein